jgi:hypothetical protein
LFFKNLIKKMEKFPKVLLKNMCNWKKDFEFSTIETLSLLNGLLTNIIKNQNEEKFRKYFINLF